MVATFHWGARGVGDRWCSRRHLQRRHRELAAMAEDKGGGGSDDNDDDDDNDEATA